MLGSARRKEKKKGLEPGVVCRTSFVDGQGQTSTVDGQGVTGIGSSELREEEGT